MKRIFTLIFGLLSLQSIAQTSDIGILIGSDKEMKLTLEFRKPIREKYSLKFGIGIGGDYLFGNDYYNFDYIYKTTDSSITSHSNYSIGSNYNLKLGIERSIRSSPFSIGLDLLLGYSNIHYARTEKNYILKKYGQWEYETYIYGEYNPNSINNSGPDSTYAKVNVIYFKPALQLNIGLDLPLGKRLLVNLAFQNSIGIAINIRESNKTDPLNEFGHLKNNTLDYNLRFNVGLRYKFKT